MARKKSRCKLIGKCFVIPHDTIPSNVMPHFMLKQSFYKIIDYNRCENYLLISLIISLLVFGVNWTQPIVSNFGIIFLNLVPLVISIISFSGLLYWTYYFWNQYSLISKLLNVIKVFFFGVWLIIIIGFFIAVLSMVL